MTLMEVKMISVHNEKMTVTIYLILSNYQEEILKSMLNMPKIHKRMLLVMIQVKNLNLTRILPEWEEKVISKLVLRMIITMVKP
jgi:hypothetical protein